MKKVVACFLVMALLMTNCLVVFAKETRVDEWIIEEQELSEEISGIQENENAVQSQYDSIEDSENIILRSSEKENEHISYNVHIQDIGWQGWKQEGESAGTTGQKKQLEAIQIKLPNLGESGNVQYRAHVQNIGWQDWKQNGETAGTTGEKLRLEAIEIKLTGEVSEKYDIYYRVHSQEFGWLGWAKNGETAGTIGYCYRAEAIEIILVQKGESIVGNVGGASKTGLVSYQVHIQNLGNQAYVLDGSTSGTIGEKLRLEGIRIKLPTLSNSSIEYRVHVQDIGWQGWKKNNELAGTTGERKKIEAIEIKLSGEAEKKYDVYYRVHCQNFGWLGWAKNGESAGTAGYSYRMEAIQIQLVEKGSDNLPGIGDAFKQKFLTYQAYIQGNQIQDSVSDGEVAGTEAKKLRLEGIKIGPCSTPGTKVTYRSYIQGVGWQTWKSNKELSGEPGKGIEVIQIQLSGAAAEQYDIYYRVHVANLGWLGWAKNGDKAGSRYYNASIEAIQIQMLEKGDNSISVGESYKEGIQNGIDVSEYNGNINWSQVKNSGISFAMLRCVKGSNPNSISVDAKFNQNIKGASENGISVGVYRYSYADSASDARNEAMAVVNAIQNSGYRIQYPIAYDIEDENTQGDLSKAQLTEIIKIFKGIVENHGYKFMIYANKNWLDNKIDMNSFKDEDVWIARYRDDPPSLGHGYTGAGNVTIWQYSDRGTVPGIQGAVDMNIGYKEY